MTTAILSTEYCPIICPTLPDPEEMLGVIEKAFGSGRVTVGEQVAALEDEVSARVDVRNTIAVSSGTSGLMLLIRALGLPEGSEVITPSFTFAATSHALLWNGLRPVFCDSDPQTFTMDPACARSLITERTSAIYPVCVFGVPGDIAAYQTIAQNYGLALIFDSAQGIGSTYRRRAVGSFGVGEVFSLSPTKVVTGLEGGLVTTNDDQLATQIRYMRDYGKAPDGEDMNWLGLSARMTELNAAVARWSLARLDTWVANRTEICDRYLERLGHLPGVSFQAIPTDRHSSRNYMVVLLDPAESPITRDELYRALKNDGIQTKRYFYPALHNQTLYQSVTDGRKLPIAQAISERSIAVPMYSHMPLETVEAICDRIVAHFEQVDAL